MAKSDASNDAEDAEYELIPGGNNEETGMSVSCNYPTAMVVVNPRSLAKVTQRVLEEADQAGEDFIYAWGKGKDAVEGASVGLINCCLRNMGNCVAGMRPVQETAASWIFTAYVVDRETGYALERQFRQSKNSVVHGNFDRERKDDIRFQIGQSKATRNVGKNFLPSWLIDKAMERAKAGARTRMEAEIKAKGSPAFTQDKIVRLMKTKGVTLEQILAKFEIASVAALDIDRLLILNSLYKQIDTGESRVDELFPAAGEAQKETPPETKTESKSEPSAEKKDGKPPAMDPVMAMKEYEAKMVRQVEKDAVRKLFDEYFNPENPIQWTRDDMQDGIAMRDTQLQKIAANQTGESK